MLVLQLMLRVMWSDVGKAFPGQPSIAHDSDIEGLKRLAAAMK